MRRPVNTSSLARVRPTTRGRRCVPPALNAGKLSAVQSRLCIARTRATQPCHSTLASVANPCTEKFLQRNVNGRGRR